MGTPSHRPVPDARDAYLVEGDDHLECRLSQAGRQPRLAGQQAREEAATSRKWDSGLPDGQSGRGTIGAAPQPEAQSHTPRTKYRAYLQDGCDASGPE